MEYHELDRKQVCEGTKNIISIFSVSIAANASYILELDVKRCFVEGPWSSGAALTETLAGRFQWRCISPKYLNFYQKLLLILIWNIEIFYNRVLRHFAIFGGNSVENTKINIDGRTHTINWDYIMTVMIGRQNFRLRTKSVGQSSNNVATGSRILICLEWIEERLFITDTQAKIMIRTTNVLRRKFTTSD